MARNNAAYRRELEEQLRFERLVGDLSSGFINLAPGEVDQAILDAQRRICRLKRTMTGRLPAGPASSPT